MELVIASKNAAKIQELKTIISNFFPDLYIRSLFDFPKNYQEIENTFSFVDNAIAKAVSMANAIDFPCIAEETGLVVPFLGDEQVSL